MTTQRQLDNWMKWRKIAIASGQISPEKLAADEADARAWAEWYRSLPVLSEAELQARHALGLRSFHDE